MFVFWDAASSALKFNLIWFLLRVFLQILPVIFLISLFFMQGDKIKYNRHNYHNYKQVEQFLKLV